MKKPIFKQAHVYSILNHLVQSGVHEKVPGILVASVSFGFWTAFFHKDFDGFWRQNPHLNQVFPYVKKRPYGQLLRKQINRRLTFIKKPIRNRVFHPIWNREKLYVNYEKSLDVIYWISPEKYALLRKIDRFPDIYSQGWQGYLDRLDDHTHA